MMDDVDTWLESYVSFLNQDSQYIILFIHLIHMRFESKFKYITKFEI